MDQIPEKRILGDARGAHPGPTLLCIAGVHGNEPGGVAASERVLARLKKAPELFSGRMITLYGNIPALEEDCRYIDEDLNRIWTEALVNDKATSSGSVEKNERRQLLAAVTSVLASSPAAVTLLDLHSTSGEGPPFVPYAPDGQDALLARLGLPHVASTENSIHGSLAAFFSGRKIPSFVVEGGEHYSAATIDALESIIWIFLSHAKQLTGELAKVERHAANLQKSCAGVPKSMMISAEHRLAPGHEFRMLPGFKNFQRVEAGQVIAQDASGDVRMPESGWLLFPRYQSLGSVGFFVMKEG